MQSRFEIGQFHVLGGQDLPARGLRGASREDPHGFRMDVTMTRASVALRRSVQGPNIHELAGLLVRKLHMI